MPAVVLPPAPKFEKNGGAGNRPEFGDGITLLIGPPCPVTVVALFVQPNASWVPISRAKFLVAATTRASISTSGVLVSSCLISRSTFGITPGISLMMSELVRLSAITVPLEDKKLFNVGTTSLAVA